MEENEKEVVEETNSSEEEKGLPEGVSKALSIIALIFLALAIAGIAYVFTPKKTEPEATATPSASPEETVEPEETEEASPSATPTEEPTEEPTATPEESVSPEPSPEE